MNTSARRVSKGVLSGYRRVPNHIVPPDYANSGLVAKPSKGVYIFSNDEVLRMKESANLARRMLDYACSVVEVGMTTDDIDSLTHAEIVKHNAYPSPLNYSGFPKSICTSVNEIACHGIPDDRPLEKGDLLSIDVSLFCNGYHGDNCGTVIVGESAKGDHEYTRAERILKGAQKALQRSIDAIGPGICITAIGNAIEKSAMSDNLEVVPHFSGHGLGKQLHMLPFILHFRNKERFILRPNMIFTIEPILSEGSPDVEIWSDGWTAATVDGSWCAQFEHEILITPHGAEIITVP